MVVGWEMPHLTDLGLGGAPVGFWEVACVDCECDCGNCPSRIFWWVKSTHQAPLEVPGGFWNAGSWVLHSDPASKGVEVCFISSLAAILSILQILKTQELRLGGTCTKEWGPRIPETHKLWRNPNLVPTLYLHSISLCRVISVRSSFVMMVSAQSYSPHQPPQLIPISQIPLPVRASNLFTVTKKPITGNACQLHPSFLPASPLHSSFLLRNLTNLGCCFFCSHKTARQIPPPVPRATPPAPIYSLSQSEMWQKWPGKSSPRIPDSEPSTPNRGFGGAQNGASLCYVKLLFLTREGQS